jgi:hypothetical protein
LSGIIFLSKEITTFDPSSTKAVASPILNPFNAEDVVARVGHIPRIRTKVGFSFINPFRNTFRFELLFIVFLL